MQWSTTVCQTPPCRLPMWKMLTIRRASWPRRPCATFSAPKTSTRSSATAKPFRDLCRQFAIWDFFAQTFYFCRDDRKIEEKTDSQFVFHFSSASTYPNQKKKKKPKKNTHNNVDNEKLIKLITRRNLPELLLYMIYFATPMPDYLSLTIMFKISAYLTCNCLYLSLNPNDWIIVLWSSLNRQTDYHLPRWY